MYLRHYGFRRLPFNNTPDTRFFFRSPRHNEALAALLYTVKARKGFAMLTGEVGAGKTTVARSLFNNLEPDTVMAIVTNTHLTSMQLLQIIAEEFGIATENLGRVAVLRKIEDFLVKAARMGQDVIILIDEAQNLKPAVLEEVRMLSNLETEDEKLIQIVLLGQPELKKKLALPRLEQLRQRISVFYHLKPLEADQAKAYIRHRLKVASETDRVYFTEEALDIIVGYSKGVPRLINQICDSALLNGFIYEKEKIDAALMREVIAESPMMQIISDNKMSLPGVGGEIRNERLLN